MKKGAFVFVLHSHLPYVRKKGKWPHGEEMLYEAMAETYIPLLDTLNDLMKEKYHPKLTLGLTPILLEQLADPYINKEFEKYLKTKIKVAKRDIKIYSGPLVIKDPVDRKEHQDLARFYVAYYQNVLDSYSERYGKDLVHAFKILQDNGVLDIITCTATHAYLPLYENEASIIEQLKVGVATYKKHFDREPRGIWLAECAYRPGKEMNGQYMQSIEKMLEMFHLEYFFTDSHVFSSSSHMSVKETTMFGPYNYKEVKYDVEYLPKTVHEKPTYKGYTVGKSNVSVFARDNVTSMQVWSHDHGYPGDEWYRDFHAKDAISGLQYCRVTNFDHTSSNPKVLYNPQKALEKTKEHADHFVGVIKNRLNEIYAQTKEYSVLVSCYDTELFGHWWFEGVEFLKQVFMRLEDSKEIDTANINTYVNKYPSKEDIFIPESSWGLGGEHYVWNNENTAWMWPIIHDLSQKVQQACVGFPNQKGLRKKMLNQLVRELLLLHSSDWPFLVTTMSAKDYAIERFNQHKGICENLLTMIYQQHPLSIKQKESIKIYCEEDNPFQMIDYTTFGKKTV